MTTWAAGDYPAMARRLLPASLAAVAAADVQPGERVLDVGTGTGTGALLAALRGGEVTGVDFEPDLLDLARQHAHESAADVTWLLGDATELPVPDGSVDVVLSLFGVMYAYDQVKAAAELARACARTGRLVLTAWLPGSVLPAMGQVLAQYLPPLPVGSSPPSRWGDADAVTELLGAFGLTATSTSTRRLRLGFVDAGAASALLMQSAGHLVAERSRLEDAGRWQAVLDDLHAFVSDRGTHSNKGFTLELDYLLVIAQPT